MAKLGERDLERILGPEWREKIGIAGPGRGRLQAQMDAKREHDSLNDRMFTAGGAFAIGVGLVISSLSAMKGLALWSWFAFAITLIVISALWMVSLQRRFRANAKGTATLANMPSGSDQSIVLDPAHSVRTH